MIRDRTLRARETRVSKLPVTGELLRGSLLERTVRHTKDCPKCARGEGHRVFVLTVTYAGGRTQQFSVRRERVAEVRRWLDNYQKRKQVIEDICDWGGRRRILFGQGRGNGEGVKRVCIPNRSTPVQVNGSYSTGTSLRRS